MNAVLPLAQRMLLEHGEFYPYGGYMTPTGDIVDVGAKDPGTAYPKSQDLIEVLRNSLRRMASERKAKAAAIVFDVVVELPNSTRKSDAIQVSVEHIDGYAAEVFVPYHIINHELVYDTTFAHEGDNTIFGHR